MPDGLAEAGLPDGLAEAFAHLGRLRFDHYMELALYAPASGFFATTGGAGRREGDFITSPEVGPLFGAVLADHLDELWERLGRPEPFTVVECGAGRGALAISVRAARPRCAPVLHWVMVERSDALRAEHGRHLELTPMVRPGAGASPGQDAESTGPWFTSLASMPERPVCGAVVANELLDNLPFRLLEHRGGRWFEVFVTPDPGQPGRLREELVALDGDSWRLLATLVPEPAEGARLPWQAAATRWVGSALELLQRGEVIVFDYGADTATLATRPQADWLRTYRSHSRGAGPLEQPGSQDITVDVAIDQLPTGAEHRTQGAWLRANGIDRLVEEAQVVWRERAGTGDLEAIRARSVPLEAEALTDPAGLGSFTVATWQIGI